MFKTVRSDSSKFESLKIHTLKIVPSFTVVTKEITRTTPATVSPWDMVPTLAIRVQHVTGLLLYSAITKQTVTLFTVITMIILQITAAIPLAWDMVPT
jgi:hypothetical protein